MAKTTSVSALLGKQEEESQVVPSLQGFSTPQVSLKHLIQVEAFGSIFGDLRERYGTSMLLGQRMHDFKDLVKDAVKAAIVVGKYYDELVKEESVETSE